MRDYRQNMKKTGERSACLAQHWRGGVSVGFYHELVLRGYHALRTELLRLPRPRLKPNGRQFPNTTKNYIIFLTILVRSMYVVHESWALEGTEPERSATIPTPFRYGGTHQLLPSK